MPIPTYEGCMLPLLKLLNERSEVAARDAYPALADKLDLTSEERKQLLPSGRQEVFKSRVGWARTYLKKAGLIETPRRGLWTITPRGKETADNPPHELNVDFLMQFPEFREWYENDEQVVTMGCGDACPAINAHQRLDWNLPDPAALPLDEARRVSDRIIELVRGLLNQPTPGGNLPAPLDNSTRGV